MREQRDYERNQVKVKEKQLEDGTIELSITATAQEVDKALDSAQAAVASRFGIKPDPTKTAREALEEHLKVGNVDSILQSQAVNMLIPYALDQRGITPLAQPNVPMVPDFQRGKATSFKINVMPKPHFTLSSYDPVEISVPAYKEPDIDVDAEIRANLNMYPDFVTADPHPVGPDDNCLIAIEVRLDGERLSGISTDSRVYSVGKGFMPESFDENIIGMNVGETKTFEFEGEGYDENGMRVMRTYDCTVTIKEIREEVQPELTDEWVKRVMPSYDSVDQLRKDIQLSFETQALHDYEMQLITIAQTELAKRLEGEIPDAAFESTANSIEAALRNQLAQQGMTVAEFIEEQGGEQNYKVGIMMQAQQTLRCDYALDALFEHEGLVITDEDIMGACTELNPMNPQLVRSEMESSGRGFALREVAARYAASKFLVDNAIVTTLEE